MFLSSADNRNMQLLVQTLPDATIPFLWQFRPLLRLTRESIQIIRQMSDALETCLCLFGDKEDIMRHHQVQGCNNVIIVRKIITITIFTRPILPDGPSL